MFSAELPTLLTPYLCVPSSLTITYSAVTQPQYRVNPDQSPVVLQLYCLDLELSKNLRDVAHCPKKAPNRTPNTPNSTFMNKKL